MPEELVKHAFNLLLDDRRIGEWSTSEVGTRLGRDGPQDREFWQTYTCRHERAAGCRQEAQWEGDRPGLAYLRPMGRGAAGLPSRALQEIGRLDLEDRR